MKEIEQEFLDSGGVWEEIVVGKHFDISRGDIQNQGELVPYEKGISFIAQNDANNGFVGKFEKSEYRRFNGKSIIIGRQTGIVYYQPNEFITTDGVLVLTLKNKSFIEKSFGFFIVSSLRKALQLFGYSNTVSAKKLDTLKINLPYLNNNFAYKFMENFIAELKALRVAELHAYLQATGLSNYTLSDDEQAALNAIENSKWQIFNVEELFGKATRGKRLKSADRTAGNLPFVTAGEADTGISAFIGNNVERFKPNTITIDMFGSAKYRNYEYGADDHIAVVHTDKLPKHAVLFLTSAMHKVANAGQFSYARNFYAKDADSLNIELPVKNGEPDFELMANYLQAIEKLVIKDVVDWADREIAVTEQAITDNDNLLV
ncbi:Phosphoribosylglycinamide formyltransferase [Bibersteinia trehalosi USDA-ARS-USMARC-190]|uniref:Phosphoribosylglycinamide formyltransferase n=1 Tax=Bibersteinia trehalosi USDA-ARS-USMARC-190 TaxID=1263832 RepID=W0RAP0_BIBTR|nr:restriction endonuclease subunit S [Bibersteinia trehalosi]AHG86453.1 Phosphoribosylglycinamide formyltransferase [Bibersteinia trehalosi USDA-ARS-USMARC-190]